MTSQKHSCEYCNCTDEEIRGRLKGLLPGRFFVRQGLFPGYTEVWRRDLPVQALARISLKDPDDLVGEECCLEIVFPLAFDIFPGQSPDPSSIEHAAQMIIEKEAETDSLLDTTESPGASSTGGGCGSAAGLVLFMGFLLWYF